MVDSALRQAPRPHVVAFVNGRVVNEVNLWTNIASGAHTRLMERMPDGAGPLRILHVLRAPVGGLFRHVIDLARGQAARGHRVGIVVDALTGGQEAEAALAGLSPMLELGAIRVPMSRQLGPSDASALVQVARRAARVAADVLHGHGAKGGAYARMAPCRRALRAYTPHGGSLHYGWGSPAGALYLAIERLLKARTDLFLFESAYGRDLFRAKLGDPAGLVRVVHNGIAAAELEPVTAHPEASDLVFVGELRELKGIDTLLQAIARLRQGGCSVTATIVGDGPDRTRFEREARDHALVGQVKFVGSMPARAAFSLGRLLVVPSRAESLPYVVLEGAAAGLPIIATRVGGVPEIFGPQSADLVPPANPDALARAIALGVRDLGPRLAAAARLRSRVRDCFSVDAMTDDVLAAYHEALAR
jgi:glycosyltransferase involved in cell wall biosynthesis